MAATVPDIFWYLSCGVSVLGFNYLCTELGLKKQLMASTQGQKACLKAHENFTGK